MAKDRVDHKTHLLLLSLSHISGPLSSTFEMMTSHGFWDSDKTLFNSREQGNNELGKRPAGYGLESRTHIRPSYYCLDASKLRMLCYRSHPKCRLTEMFFSGSRRNSYKRKFQGQGTQEIKGFLSCQISSLVLFPR